MEDHDFPGYVNIEFQRKRYFVFDFFRADLEAMGRFGTTVSDYLQAEAGFRKQRLAAEGPQADDPSALRSEIAELQGGFRDVLLRWLLVAFYGRFESFLFKFCRTLHQTGVCPMPQGRDRGALRARPTARPAHQARARPAAPPA